ncbi:MAG: rRNA pseudouridine synthase [Proteobacteria bacterium]|nr:rRNA pseudouridine synthase [Pseudomonadota bacterium]
MPVTRLQKILAAAGVASRRKAEEIILDSRVRVNGRIVKELGAKADPRKDRIEVDGRALVKETPVTLLMNKPRGVVCTASDPEGRETVIDLVKGVKTRIFPVGRLDFGTSGALLLTNDGDLAYALTHPSCQVAKTYLVKIRDGVSEEVLKQWRTGVDIGDVVTRPAEVFRVEEDANFTWIEVTIREGRNRQIHRMGDATGLTVLKLKRIAFAGLTITGIKIGKYRELTSRESTRLRRDYLNPSKETKKQQTDETAKPKSRPKLPNSKRRAKTKPNREKKNKN